ncbi:hypothetical protein NQZ68_019802 [Dissostichus eleginoides]|nr:hypothetical protein NQZ68_019802 [Dissostichus eleginoides]
MVLLGEPGTTRSSKEGGIGPGRTRSRSELCLHTQPPPADSRKLQTHAPPQTSSGNLPPVGPLTAKTLFPLQPPSNSTSSFSGFLQVLVDFTDFQIDSS